MQEKKKNKNTEIKGKDEGRKQRGMLCQIKHLFTRFNGDSKLFYTGFSDKIN